MGRGGTVTFLITENSDRKRGWGRADGAWQMVG